MGLKLKKKWQNWWLAVINANTPEDNHNDEEADTVDCATLEVRRGRKEGRRVSGIFKEIKTLHSIGQSAIVMSLVLNYIRMKEVMEAGTTCPMWYIIACKILRKQFGNSSFICFWHANKPKKYLLINWELHFHDELLAGTEEAHPKGGTASIVPSIQAVLSIVSRAGFHQITHEDAKLPLKPEHVYITCQDAFISAPDWKITTFHDKVGMDMAVQSLFIPKSELFTLKAFSLDILKEEWTEEHIKSKLDLNVDDVGTNKKLTTVLLLKYSNNPTVLNFIDNFSKSNTTVELLGGEVEEVASNRFDDASSSQVAVGFSFYTAPGANVSIYGVDISKEHTEEILKKMKEQVESATNGFCFLITQDGRQRIEKTDGDDIEWEEFEDPEPMREPFFKKLRCFIPKIQLLGVHSVLPIDLINVKNTNVDDSSKNQFCCGLLVLAY